MPQKIHFETDRDFRRRRFRQKPRVFLPLSRLQADSYPQILRKSQIEKGRSMMRHCTLAAILVLASATPNALAQKRLNNFVTELVNIPTAQADSYTFSVERDTWLFVRVTSDRAVSVRPIAMGLLAMRPRSTLSRSLPTWTTRNRRYLHARWIFGNETSLKAIL